MKHLLHVVFLMLLALFAAVGAHATTLTDLLNGGSITAGDKLFDQWQLVSYTASEPNRTFNAGNIDVQALNDGGLDPGPGLRFTASSNELYVAGDGIYAFVDLMFGFRVSILDPTLKIKDNSLELKFGVVTYSNDGSNDLGMFVRETVGTAPGLDDLGINTVEFSVLDDIETSKLFDSAAFSLQSQIWVTKNILVWAVDPTDSAYLTEFDQRFSQGSAVPEPSTFLLLGGGVAALIAVRRRNNRS